MLHTNVDGVLSHHAPRAAPLPRRRPHRLHGLDRGRQAYPNGASYIASKFAVRDSRHALRGGPARPADPDHDGRRRPRRDGVLRRSLPRRRGPAIAVYEGVDPGHPRRGRRLRPCSRSPDPPHVNHRRDRDQGACTVLRRTRRAPSRDSCAFAPRTTARSSSSPSPRSGRSRPSRSTCSSTPRSSAISAAAAGGARRSPATILTGALRAVQLPQLRHDGAGRALPRARASSASPAASARRRSGSRSAIGSGSLVLALALAGPPSRCIGGEGHDRQTTPSLYLRIAAIGLPFALIALAGQGYLRGIADLRTPLVIVVVANLVERRAGGRCSSTASTGDRRLGVGHRDRAGRDGRGLRRRAAARAAPTPAARRAP